MTSDYTIVLTKLSPNVGNDECVVLCNFGGYSTSGFEVIEEDPLEHPPPPPSSGSQEAKKSTVWIGLNVNNKDENTFWKIHCYLKKKKQNLIAQNCMYMYVNVSFESNPVKYFDVSRFSLFEIWLITFHDCRYYFHI